MRTSLRTAGKIETANTTSETTGNRPKSREPQTYTANAALKAAMPWLLLSPEQHAALASLAEPDP